MGDEDKPCKRYEKFHKIITVIVTVPILILFTKYYFDGTIEEGNLRKLVPPLAVMVIFIIYASIYEIVCDRPYFFEFFKIRKEMKGEN